jgi:hypothetical protein
MIEDECGMNGEDCGERVPASTWNPPTNNGGRDDREDGGKDKNHRVNQNEDCTADHPCLFAGTDSPEEWNINPDDPDYLTIILSYKFVSASLDIDRYGQWYVGIGPTLDLVSLEVPTLSVRQGRVDGFGFYQNFPDPLQQELFLTSWSFNGGGGLLYGASKTWVPGVVDYAIHPISTERGAYIPVSVGVSATYSWSGRQLKDWFYNLLK